MVYLFTFFLSLFFFFLASICYKKKSIPFIIFSGLAIFIPCIIAALRDLSIGTDTIGYQYVFFQYVKRSGNLFNFFHWTGSHEYLYLTVTYFTCVLFKKFSFVLFLNQLLVILPVYISLLKVCKNKSEILFGMFIYFFFYYNLSFNMARQSIALSFIILAFAFFEKEELKKSLFFIFIAFLFHNSAIICYPLIYLACILKKNNKHSIIISLFVVIMVTFISLEFHNILLILGNLFSFKYTSYLEVYTSVAGINKTIFFFWLVFVLINIIFKNSLKSITNNYDFYSLCSIIVLISSYTSTLILHSDRIFYYFCFPYLFLIIPQLPNNLIRRENKIFVYLLLIFLLSFYWFFTIVLNNFNMTYPYVFNK